MICRALGIACVGLVVGVSPVVGHAQRATPRDSGRAGAVPSIVDVATLTGREDIAVRSHVVPARVYVGQQATYEVGVFLSDETRARMRRNPEFIPPEMRSMLSYDLAAPATIPARIVDGRRYEVHVFRRALFPLSAGTLRIPPARLNYALPLSSSFFSREETHTERTQVSSLDVSEPPLVGRPRAFRGAVGQLMIEARVDNREGRVGDPLLLTVSVSGVGNVSLVPRPELTVAWGDAVAGLERIRVDTTSALVRGRKDFEFLVTPRKAGTLSVPAIEYAYFDPYLERYQTALSSPIEVRIAPGNALVATRQAIDSTPLLPIRREYRGELPPALPASNWYWLVIAITPVPALLLAMLRRPREPRIVTPAMRIRGMVASGSVDSSALRRDYALALAERIPGAGAMLSNHIRLARMLRRAGVSPETAADAARLLSEMDASVFGAQTYAAGDRPQRAERILRAIDEEALPREEIPRVPLRTRTTMLILFALVSTSVAIGSASEPGADFRAAVQAYDAHDLARARALFDSVTARSPRAPDAWANAGSVAWQLADTAAAAIGWQRALRLEPLAEDVRGYLESTPGFRSGPLGDVPSVPLSALAILGALFWIAAGVTAVRQPSVVRLRLTASLALAALVTALTGVWVSDIFRGKHAAIVRHAERLRASPALNAESGAEVLPGELAREIGTQTAWTRVRLRDGRSGWIETRNLASLELTD